MTETRMQSELGDPEKFLYLNSLPENQRDSMLVRLHSGKVVIEPMSTRDNGKEIQVIDGFVHHWLAIGFIPGATRDQAVALAQDYPRHPELYAPDVQRARVLSHVGQHFSVYYRFYRHAIVTAIYNTEFNVDYFLRDSSRGYCLARAVRIAEVQNSDNDAGARHNHEFNHNQFRRIRVCIRRRGLGHVSSRCPAGASSERWLKRGREAGDGIGGHDGRPGPRAAGLVSEN
jgi:hypothetical protein